MSHKCTEPGCGFHLPDSYRLPVCPWHAAPGNGLVKVIGAAGFFALGVGGLYAYSKIRDVLRKRANGEEIRGAVEEATEASEDCVDDVAPRGDCSTMRDGVDPYKVLAIERTASRDEIEAAYRQRAWKYHPDHAGDAWAFQQVHTAYDQIRADLSRRPWPQSMGKHMTPANTKMAAAEIVPALRSAGPLAQEPVVARPRKNVAVAIVLAFLFGPLGMLYSDVRGALVLLAVDLILFLPTLGLILLITWPIGVVWAAIGTNSNCS